MLCSGPVCDDTCLAVSRVPAKGECTVAPVDQLHKWNELAKLLDVVDVGRGTSHGKK